MPTALYGVALLMPAIAYYVLQIAIVKNQGKDGRLAEALGSNFKGTAIAFAFVATWISNLIYLLVALIWLVPDPRIEKIFR